MKIIHCPHPKVVVIFSVLLHLWALKRDPRASLHNPRETSLAELRGSHKFSVCRSLAGHTEHALSSYFRVLQTLPLFPGTHCGLAPLFPMWMEGKAHRSWHYCLEGKHNESKTPAEQDSCLVWASIQLGPGSLQAVTLELARVDRKTQPFLSSRQWCQSPSQRAWWKPFVTLSSPSKWGHHLCELMGFTQRKTHFSLQDRDGLQLKPKSGSLSSMETGRSWFPLITSWQPKAPQAYNW